jgi:uncharacterized protein (DUF2384 family)
MSVQLRREDLWTRALRIFGSELKADSWFHTRLSELAERTPEEVLEQDSNPEPVEAVLDRIEYGVFS